MSYKSEIRDSIIRELIEKNKKNSYKEYLLSIRLEKIRKFHGSQISFYFPVTALIGPNGGGKSTIIGAALSAYKSGKPGNVFRRSLVGDENMDNWNIEYEIIDRNFNKSGSIRYNLFYQNNEWKWSDSFNREVKFLSINRTVPIGESPLFSHRKKISANKNLKSTSKPMTIQLVENIDNIKIQAEKILGKSLNNFQLYEFQFKKIRLVKKTKKRQTGTKQLENGKIVPVYEKVEVSVKEETDIDKQYLYVGSDGKDTYSEFNFGSGETSIIRMVAEMELLPDYALVLIEEIENGLHPVAVRRVVEYFIDLAFRKNLQIIFTTHSDYAISPLPSEAIWACMEGVLQQGKLSIEALRVVSGRIDKRLAIFVEDEFAKSWLEYIIREKLGNKFEELGVYAVGGDGNAVKVHEGHSMNPSISFESLCYIDGDSRQKDNAKNKIFRLPGNAPESTIFDKVLNNLDNNIAILTVACQRSLIHQKVVSDIIVEISKTNRDPHLIFSQIGLKLGFIPTEIIQGAFISVWIQENSEMVDKIITPIEELLQ